MVAIIFYKKGNKILMKRSHIIIAFILFTGLAISSCGEYYRVMRQGTPQQKYSMAKKSFNQGEYSRVIDLIGDIVHGISPGTDEGAQAIYLLAESYYKEERNDEASALYRAYYNTYPKGRRAEEARFKAGECVYKDAADPRLDQSATYEAIKDLQLYIDNYPKGKYVDEATGMLFSLQDRLAEKEYLSAKLYYDLGLYMGNNYKSAVITAREALKTYPYTKWKEDFMFIILQSLYEESQNSVAEKYQERLREVQDQYYSYANEFPDGKYIKEANKIYKKIQKDIEA